LAVDEVLPQYGINENVSYPAMISQHCVSVLVFSAPICPLIDNPFSPWTLPCLQNFVEKGWFVACLLYLLHMYVLFMHHLK